MDLKLIPETNFLKSDISGSDSKFLIFDLEWEEQRHSVVRIGKKMATQDEHSNIFVDFVEELSNQFLMDEETIARLIIGKRFGGGQLQLQNDFIAITGFSARYGKENNRNFTKEILERNLHYKFFIPGW
ncbi:MAG: hypothetical protein QG566_171 [Patescibacteria group bacterium]|jgi:hypothetical protein|nr:hypothetical protein [Patescibacteria group bacterium]